MNYRRAPQLSWTFDELLVDNGAGDGYGDGHGYGDRCGDYE